MYLPLYLSVNTRFYKIQCSVCTYLKEDLLRSSFSLCLSLCLFVSVILSLSLSLLSCLSLSLLFSLSLSLCLSLTVILSITLFLSLSLFISLSISHSASPPLYPSIFASLSLSPLSLYLSPSLYIYLRLVNFRPIHTASLSLARVMLTIQTPVTLCTRGPGREGVCNPQQCR